MSATPSASRDRLYALLPAVHRLRDEAEGGPLRALLGAVEDQVAVLEEHADQLYDDLFAETCAPWVLPYLADLLGVEALPPETLDPRGEVANTVAYRRRKGTPPMLEQLAGDVMGLPARAVEFFELVAATQHVNHLRPASRAWGSVRHAARLAHAGGAFERLPGQPGLARTAEVRAPARGGRYNLPNLGVFLWRLRPYRLGRTPAVPAPASEVGGALAGRCFRFHPLGIDTALFHLPQTEDDPGKLAEPVNVPGPIGRRALAAAPADFYGRDRSFFLEHLPADAAARLAAGWPAVALADVVPADLSTWAAPADPAKVAVDPVLGRIAFGAPPALPPVATFHYGFGADLGGGAYGRGSVEAGEGTRLRVSALGTADGAFATLAEALDALPAAGGVVEVMDGGRYAVPAGAALEVAGAEPGRRVVLRAADGVRPTLLLEGDWMVRGGPDDSLTLDGFLVSGGALAVGEPGETGYGLGHLRLRHCTLVPRGEAPSLRLRSRGTRVEVEHAVTGPLWCALDGRVRIADSVVDAGGGAAYAGPAGTGYGAPLEVERSTVLGSVTADALEYASNSLFLERVLVRRRQAGCVRYSYLPAASRVPRRFRCQPDGPLGASALRPAFTSVRWGDPGYAQLSHAAPPEIRRGADDESEMGVFHDLFLPLREAHLRARLEESLRFGQEAGIFYAT